MKPGFTAGMEEERDRRRKILLTSILMETTFGAADVARILSQHKNGRVMSADVAKMFLLQMEEDGLITRANVSGGAKWCRKRVSIAEGRWVADNGIRLGGYFPGVGT